MGAAASSHILKLGNLRSVKAGEVLVMQGQSSPRLHYVMSGELTIACQDPSDASKQIKLGTRGKGEVIGEISFLLNTPPTASVLVAAD
jgi:CRP-like cAMP-binding protein